MFLICYIINHPGLCQLVVVIQLIIIWEVDEWFYALKIVSTLRLKTIEIPTSSKRLLLVVKTDTLWVLKLHWTYLNQTWWDLTHYQYF